MQRPHYGYRVFYSGDDQAFVATCTEMEGLSGLGATPERALRELRVALELALEELHANAVAIPQPLIELEYSGQFRLRLARSMHASLAARAVEEGVSLNSLATAYIALGLGAQRGTNATHMQVGNVSPATASATTATNGAPATTARKARAR